MFEQPNILARNKIKQTLRNTLPWLKPDEGNLITKPNN